MLNEMIVLKI